MKYMVNPHGFTLRKWFYDLLGIDYNQHDPIVERVAASLTTAKDLEDFGKLIGQVYYAGFMKAFEEYRKQAEQFGLNVTLSPPEPPAN